MPCKPSPAARGLAAALALLPLGALAQEGPWVSDGGVAYEEVAGGPGATLRSVGTQTYHVGAAGAEVTGVETVRLSPDCTARSALAGEGAWFRTGEGFTVVFVEGAGLSFVDRPPPAAAGPGCAASSDAAAGWVSGSGRRYDLGTEEGGDVLTLHGDGSYRPGHMGADARPATGEETIRLRGDCTALSSLMGDGMWVRVDGGTAVSWLAGDTIVFDAAPPAGFGPDC